MASYEVLLSKVARKQLDALPSGVNRKLIERISNLSLLPRPSGYKKLKGYKNAFRIRVGDYRIIYDIEDKVLRIRVVAISHRKDVYE